MRIALHTCLPDNFLVCWPPVRALSVFHGNLPQKIWGTYFPHGESTSWDFPAKIRNCLRPIPSFDMMSKFPGSDHSCRRRYVVKLLAERINKNKKKNEIYICEAVCDAVREWSEVTRPTADCQTGFFRRFKWFGKILIKVVERSRDSGWGHATVGRLSNNVFWTFQAIRKFFEKSRWTVTRQWSEVTRPLADCQTSFLDVLSNLGKFWKKSLNGHATVVGGHATVGRLSKNVFWTFQAIWENFEKSRWTVTRQWLRSRDRRPTVKQRFLNVSSN